MRGLLGIPFSPRNSVQLSPLMVLGRPPAGTKASSEVRDEEKRREGGGGGEAKGNEGHEREGKKERERMRDSE